MSGVVQLRYTPVRIGSGDTITINGSRIGGILCSTAGTLTITLPSGDDLITDLPVAEGWNHIPLSLPTGTTITSTTAVGVIGV